MTTRKVTAIEEKVLALAVEWAEKREAYELFYTSGAWKTQKDHESEALCKAKEQCADSMFRLGKRLLKQQRAKGEKK